MNIGFYLGNTVKYIASSGRKNDMFEDLKKDRQYFRLGNRKIEKKRS